MVVASATAVHRIGVPLEGVRLAEALLPAGSTVTVAVTS